MAGFEFKNPVEYWQEKLGGALEAAANASNAAKAEERPKQEAQKQQEDVFATGVDTAVKGGNTHQQAKDLGLI